MKLAIIGAGWSGLSAAVAATEAGHHATVFEASRHPGGRARAVQGKLPNGTEVCLDNGQHILIGAYRDTLKMMALVGVKPATSLLRLPLSLKFPDEKGIEFPNWPSPMDALAGIFGAAGWKLPDKFSLLIAALRWQWRRFNCPDHLTVAQLCGAVSPTVMAELIEPLCVSALNTPANRASGQVFLRVLQDSLFAAPGSSNLLLPQQDLSTLFPLTAAAWLAERGTPIRFGARVENLAPNLLAAGWNVNGEAFDAAILATSSFHAAQLLSNSTLPESIAGEGQIERWIGMAKALRFEAITTVYAFAPQASLRYPMLALRSSASGDSPAQFVFDRGQLGGPFGVLAFVVSASTGDRARLESQVLRQASTQLSLTLEAVQTIVEKRATFACTPGLTRPPMRILPGLFACGDYCEGPYPATLEGAVRSGIGVVSALSSDSFT